jgi:hypothetical protein
VSWPLGNLVLLDDRIVLGIAGIPVRGPAPLRWFLGVEIPLADIIRVERMPSLFKGWYWNDLVFRTTKPRTDGAIFRTWTERMDMLAEKLLELNVDVDEAERPPLGRLWRV